MSQEFILCQGKTSGAGKTNNKYTCKIVFDNNKLNETVKIEHNAKLPLGGTYFTRLTSDDENKLNDWEKIPRKNLFRREDAHVKQMWLFLYTATPTNKDYLNYSWLSNTLHTDIWQFVLENSGEKGLKITGFTPDELLEEYSQYVAYVKIQNQSRNKQSQLKIAHPHLFYFYKILEKLNSDLIFNPQYWINVWYPKLNFIEVYSLLKYYKKEHIIETLYFWQLLTKKAETNQKVKLYKRNITERIKNQQVYKFLLKINPDSPYYNLHHFFQEYNNAVELQIIPEMIAYLHQQEDQVEKKEIKAILEILGIYNTKEVDPVPNSLLEDNNQNSNIQEDEYVKMSPRPQGLTPKQYAALETIDKNNVSILTGGAGTGKSKIISEIFAHYTNNGKQVLILTPTGKAVQNLHARLSELEKQYKGKQDTKEKNNKKQHILKQVNILDNDDIDIEKFIIDKEDEDELDTKLTKKLTKQPTKKEDKGWNINAKVRTIHSYFKWFTFKPNLDTTIPQENTKPSIIIFEESSMITSANLLYALQNLRLDQVEKIIFVGDPNQLPPVSGGAIFLAMCSIVGLNFAKIKLDTNLRASDVSSLVDFQKHVLRKYDNRRNFVYSQPDYIEEENLPYDENTVVEQLPFYTGTSGKDFSDEHKSKLSQIIAREYYKNEYTHGDNYSIISYTNSLNDQINKYMGRQLKQKGITDSTKSIYYPNKGWYVNLKDKLVITKNFTLDNKFFVNGEIVYLLDFEAKIGAKEVKKISFGDDFHFESLKLLYKGEVIEIKSYQLDDMEDSILSYLTLGYATTVHKAQGGEYNHVYVLINDLVLKDKNKPLDVNTPGYTKLRTNNLESFYTAISRAQRKVWIYLSENLLKDGINEFNFYLSLPSEKYISLEAIKNDPHWKKLVREPLRRAKEDFKTKWEDYIMLPLSQREIRKPRFSVKKFSPQVFYNIIPDELYELWEKLNKVE